MSNHALATLCNPHVMSIDTAQHNRVFKGLYHVEGEKQRNTGSVAC